MKWVEVSRAVLTSTTAPTSIDSPAAKSRAVIASYNLIASIISFAAAISVAAIPWSLLDAYVLKRPAAGLFFARKPERQPTSP